MVIANCFHCLHGEKIVNFQKCKPKHVFLLVAMFKFLFALKVTHFLIIFSQIMQNLRLSLSGAGHYIAS